MLISKEKMSGKDSYLNYISILLDMCFKKINSKRLNWKSAGHGRGELYSEICQVIS